jgi:hypothetical protein
MNGIHRKGGTMLTADEVAAVCGGAANDAAPIASPDTVIEATDYPRNPAGPVTTESLEPKFNRK